MAQFDNESAFSGGNHPWVLGKVVRLCLYMGIDVLFIPLGEADYNSPVETFNHLWRNDSGGSITSHAVAISHGFSALFSLGIAVSISPRASPRRLSVCGWGLGCTRLLHARLRA